MQRCKDPLIYLNKDRSNVFFKLYLFFVLYLFCCFILFFDVYTFITK